MSNDVGQAEKLTMAGLEVDTIEDRFGYLQTVKVAHVASVRPHPDADKLKCCTVSTGEDQVEVVCGAPNVAEGQRVPLASPGTVLPDGREIKSATIRGVASAGMICSQAELALSTDHSGIWVLPDDLPLGASVAEALKLSDHILDIDLTPNRPDCLSLIGGPTFEGILNAIAGLKFVQDALLQRSEHFGPDSIKLAQTGY